MIRILLMLSILSGDPDIPVIETEEVLVTATKLREKGCSFVTVIPVEKSHDDSLASVLTNTEGTSAWNYGSPAGFSYASIRGSTGNQVLVLIDGIRVNNAEEGGFDLSAVPLSSVDRIEVLRGGGSSIYGADALGGVINVITRTPGLGPSTTVQASYGSFNTGSLSVSQAGKVRSLDYLASVTTKGSEGNYPYDDPRMGLTKRENNSFFSLDLMGKGRVTIVEKTKVSISGDIYGSDMGVPGDLLHPTPEGKRTNRRGFFSASVAEKWPSNGETELKAYFLSQIREYYDNVSVPEDRKDIYRNYGTGVTLRSEGSLGWNSLYCLLEGRDEFAHSTPIGKKGRTTAAIYVNDTIDPVQGFIKLPLSMRFDLTDDFGSAWSPRVGFLLSLLKDLSMKGNIGTSFRAPALDDLYWPEDAFAKGNPLLRPEKAINYDIGAEGGIWGLRAEVAYFRNDVRDLIQWTPGAKWSPINITGTTVLQGVEAGTAFTVPHASLLVNYTYLSAKDGEERPLFYRPAHKVYSRIDLGAGISSFFLDFQYVSFRYIDLTAQNTLPPYMIFGLGAAITWKSFEVRTRVRQVFDTALTPLVSYQEVYLYPVPGLTWDFGVTWKQ